MMLVFLLMSLKIILTLFPYLYPPPNMFYASSFLMLYVWSTENDSASLLAFRSDFCFGLYILYILVWFVTPWLAKSKKSNIATTGLSFVIALNLFDIISCILCAFPVTEKTLNISVSILIICLSIWAIHKHKTV